MSSLVDIISRKKIKYFNEGDLVMACYCRFLEELSDTEEDYKTVLLTLKNIESQNCPECESKDSTEYNLVCLTEELAVFSMKCTNCSVNYSGIKMTRDFYDKYFHSDKHIVFKEGAFIEILNYMSEIYKEKGLPIISAYYDSWVRKLRNQVEVNTDMYSKIVFNWKQVCPECKTSHKKKFKKEEKEDMDITFSYNCNECDYKFGSINVDERSLPEELK